MTSAKLRLAMALMRRPETRVGDLRQEPGVTRQTLYRHISPKSENRQLGSIPGRRTEAGGPVHDAKL